MRHNILMIHTVKWLVLLRAIAFAKSRTSDNLKNKRNNTSFTTTYRLT